MISATITQSNQMARIGVFQCIACGHEFPASEGGLVMAEEYSCISCDTTVKISRFSEPKSVVCKECGGESVPGLKRMCPNCRSRNTKIIKVELHMD